MIDGGGNYIQCRCAPGYLKNVNDCLTVSTMVNLYAQWQFFVESYFELELMYDFVP